jgi:hypothetical protein
MKSYFELERQSQHFTLSKASVQTFGGHFQTIEPLQGLETLESLLHYQDTSIQLRKPQVRVVFTDPFFQL